MTNQTKVIVGTFPGDPIADNIRNGFVKVNQNMDVVDSSLSVLNSAVFDSSIFNVKTYGALGDDTTDDSAAIQAALDAAFTAGGGIVYLPAGIYKLMSVLTVRGKITLEGQSDASRLRSYASVGNVVELDAAQYSMIRDLTIEGSQPYGGVVPPVDSWGIYLKNNCFQCVIDNVKILYTHNGIGNGFGTETVIRHVILRQLFGSSGIQWLATSLVDGNFRGVIDDLSCDNPYPVTITSGKTYNRTTSYTVGDIVFVNFAVYQCTQSGTTGSGIGPSSQTSFTTPIVDGSCQWTFVCGNLTWIELNSFSYSLVVNKAAVLNGVYGIAMRDGLHNGSSSPQWIFAWDVEADHNFLAGVSAEGGNGFYLNGSWIGSTLDGNGVQCITNFVGEFFIGGGTRIAGCAQHGILLNVGNDIQVKDCFIGANSQASSATFHGITAAAALGNFMIDGNKIGTLVNTGSELQGWGIFINSGCTNYVVVGNRLQGNISGTISDGGSAPKAVANNL